MPVTANTASMELLFSRIGPDTRASVLHGIIDEFLGENAALRPSAAATIDDLMLRLAERLGASARASLSERLAHHAAGPRRTVRAFALDPDASVATPVLRHSPLLHESDLLAVARVRGQAHLSAIAGRNGLSEALSDLVALRGEAAVLRELAGNRDARLSARGLDGLARAALGDERLTEALTARPDMPLGLADFLVQRLGPRVHGPAAVREPSEVQAEATIIPLRRPSEGQAAPTEAPRRRPLSDEDVATCIDEGRWSDAVLLIAKLSGQPVGLVADALASPDPSRPLLVMRLANLGTDVAEKILLARAGGAGSGRGIADQKAAYLRLSRAAAERALRLVRLHSSVMGGLDAAPHQRA